MLIAFHLAYAVWAGNEAFHKNHLAPAPKLVSAPTPKFGESWTDAKVGQACGSGIFASACGTGLSCISRGICAEDVGDGGKCGKSAGVVDCASGLCCVDWGIDDDDGGAGPGVYSCEYCKDSV